MKIISPAFLLVSALAFYIFQAAPTPEIQELNLPDPSLVQSVLVVNMIPAEQSGESSQDSEPFLAVSGDPLKPEQSLLIGAAYKGEFQGAGATPLMLSSTDGYIWKQSSMLNVKQIGSHTYCFSGKKNSFYGAVQIPEGANQTISVFHAADPTTDPTLGRISNITFGAAFSDAPFIQAHAFGAAPQSADEEDKRVDYVYVGYNYFGFSDQKTRTAAIQVAADGKPFVVKQLEARDTGTAGQDGPSVRPAVANDKTVYVAFLHWSSKEGNRFRGDVIVSRDDDAGRSDSAFRALVDPSDGLPGRIVIRDRLFSAFDKLDQQRIIAPLSLAVHPTNSANVYVAWGDYDEKLNSHVLHIRRSDDRGQKWSEDLQTIPSATNPALAVSSDGFVGFLYQQLVESGPKGPRRWETKFSSSRDGGNTWTPTPLAVFPTEGEPQAKSESGGPYLGFRSHLLAVGSSFYGIFSAPNKPEQKYFPQGVKFQRSVDNGELTSKNGSKVNPSIDPYFFRVTPQVEKTYKRSISPGTDDATKPYLLTALFRTLSSLTPILVALAVLLTAFAVVQLRRAQQTSLTTSEQLRKTADEIQGPPITNYNGYVSIRFTDLNGSPIEQPNSESHLIVTFADTSQSSNLEEAIVLQGGKDAPEVVFSVVVDSIDFEIDPEHTLVSVPMKGSRDAVFKLTPLDGVGQSLYVQVFEKTRLVQVVAHTGIRDGGGAT